MSNSNGKITAPIGLAPDPYPVLGATPQNEWYDVSTICADPLGTINKWSRNKPLRKETFATLPRPIQHNSGDGIWGMEYPRVTGTNMLKSASMGIKAAGEQTGYRNYAYLSIRPNTDIARVDDFEGYNQHAPQPVNVGMQGNTGSQVTVNGFDTAELRFFVYADANTEIGINEFWPETNLVFVVELYYKDSSTLSSDTPFLWAASTKLLSWLGKFDGLSMIIPMSELKTAFKAKWPSVDIDNGEVKLLAVYGVMGLSSSGETHRAAATSADHFKAVNADFSGLGYIAPWNNGTHVEHQANITIANYFSYVLTAQQYAVTFPATSASFFALTTAKTTYTADLGVKTTIENTGTKTIHVYSKGTAANASYVRLRLRAHAVGQFRETAGDQAYSTPYEGRTIDAGITSNQSITTLTNLISIAQKATATVYLYLPGIIPVGKTTGIVVEASTDNGVSWVIANYLTANITRN